VSHLLAKHKNAENNLRDIEKELNKMDTEGANLIRDGIPGRKEFRISWSFFQISYTSA